MSDMLASILKGVLLYFVSSFDIPENKLLGKNINQFFQVLFMNAGCNMGGFRSILLVLF